MFGKNKYLHFWLGAVAFGGVEILALNLLGHSEYVKLLVSRQAALLGGDTLGVLVGLAMIIVPLFLTYKISPLNEDGE